MIDVGSKRDAVSHFGGDVAIDSYRIGFRSMQRENEHGE
jgi:hypothetical protein